MKTLRVGVIGLGMGRGHVRGFQGHPQAKVAAVADLDADRVAAVREEFNIPVGYASGEELLQNEELDVVSIATPNKFHKPLTLAAFKAGCHVLCEKPMAMNAKEARQMLAAAEKADRRLMINFSHRFFPGTWIAKEQVDSGVVGEIYYGRTVWLRRRGLPGFGGWFGQKKLSGGGPLIDLGVHRLDMALWFMGYPQPVWVMGNTWGHLGAKLAKEQGKDFDVEDFATGLIRFDNDACLAVEASWAGHMRESERIETQLFGTEGGVCTAQTGGGAPTEVFCERNGRHFNTNLVEPLPAIKPSTQYFVDCLLSGEPHTATGEQGLIVMEILDALYKSARTGKPVQIKKR